MNRNDLELCILSKPETVKEFPFGPEAAVYKVCGKMFALIGDDNRVNLKCEPDEASALRASFPEITPGYHMNKVHWNTLDFTQNLTDELIRHCVDESYRLVVSSLKKADRDRLCLMI